MARRNQAQSNRRRAKKVIPHGQVHVYATFNNTIVTFTDLKGNTICWSSAGNTGFRGSRFGRPGDDARSLRR